jgi:hypothetical protein
LHEASSLASYGDLFWASICEVNHKRSKRVSNQIFWLVSGAWRR